MRKIIFLFLCIVLFFSCHEQPGFVISGKVDWTDLNRKYVYLYDIGKKEIELLDSAQVDNGVFTFKGRRDEAIISMLRFDEHDVPSQSVRDGENSPYTVVFILENGKLNAVLSEVSSVTGTSENDNWSALRNEIKTLRADIRQLTEDMASEDSEIASKAGEQYDWMERQVIEAVSHYIHRNPDKLSVAKLVYDFRYFLSEETKGEALGKAGKQFKAISGIDKLIEHQEVLNKVATGKKITDFEMADVNGNMRKLSDYAGNGQVTLIDFWASWCPPCRRDMPHLVEVYKQFKDKGFGIVGVSLDHRKEAWEKGIADLHITWPQLSDLQSWQNRGAILYGVTSIPHTVLVDKDGTILAKNLRGKALDEKLAEIFQ